MGTSYCVTWYQTRRGTEKEEGKGEKGKKKKEKNNNKKKDASQAWLTHLSTNLLRAVALVRSSFIFFLRFPNSQKKKKRKTKWGNASSLC